MLQFELAELLGFEKEIIEPVYARFDLQNIAGVSVSGRCVCATHAGWNYSTLVCFKLVL